MAKRKRIDTAGGKYLTQEGGRNSNRATLMSAKNVEAAKRRLALSGYPQDVLDRVNFGKGMRFNTWLGRVDKMVEGKPKLAKKAAAELNDDIWPEKTEKTPPRNRMSEFDTKELEPKRKRKSNKLRGKKAPLFDARTGDFAEADPKKLKEAMRKKLEKSMAAKLRAEAIEAGMSIDELKALRAADTVVSPTAKSALKRTGVNLAKRLGKGALRGAAGVGLGVAGEMAFPNEANAGEDYTSRNMRKKWRDETDVAGEQALGMPVGPEGVEDPSVMSGRSPQGEPLEQRKFWEVPFEEMFGQGDDPERIEELGEDEAEPLFDVEVGEPDFGFDVGDPVMPPQLEIGDRIELLTGGKKKRR